MRRLFIGLVFLLTCSCKGRDKNADARSDAEAVQHALRYRTCDLLKISDDSLITYIIDNAEFVIESLRNTAQDDSCILAAVSKIPDQEPLSSSLLALDELSTYSIGYLSEALAYHALNLFTNNFKEFYAYCEKRPHSSLRQFVIWELGIEIGVRGMTKDQFLEKFRENIRNESEAKFVTDLLAEVEVEGS